MRLMDSTAAGLEGGDEHVPSTLVWGPASWRRNRSGGGTTHHGSLRERDGGELMPADKGAALGTMGAAAGKERVKFRQ